MRRIVLFAVVVAPLWSGCGGSQRKAEDMDWSSEQPEAVRPLRETEELSPPPGAAPAAADAKAPETWVGVRHDLMMAPSAPHKETCSCLAVAVGDPGDPSFQWRDRVPEVGGDAMVIAVSARGVSCPGGEADESKRRASIAGVHAEGNDVVVEIEELPEGRPIASGAVIAKPGPGGSVFVRGRSAKVPYARPTGGRCKVR